MRTYTLVTRYTRRLLQRCLSNAIRKAAEVSKSLYIRSFPKQPFRGCTRVIPRLIADRSVESLFLFSLRTPTSVRADAAINNYGRTLALWWAQYVCAQANRFSNCVPIILLYLCSSGNIRLFSTVHSVAFIRSAFDRSQMRLCVREDSVNDIIPYNGCKRYTYSNTREQNSILLEAYFVMPYTAVTTHHAFHCVDTSNRVTIRLHTKLE